MAREKFERTLPHVNEICRFGYVGSNPTLSTINFFIILAFKISYKKG